MKGINNRANKQLILKGLNATAFTNGIQQTTGVQYIASQWKSWIAHNSNVNNLMFCIIIHSDKCIYDVIMVLIFQGL